MTETVYSWEPRAIKETSSGLNTIDIRAMHLAHGIIFITGEITDTTANDVISQIIYLIREKKDVKLVLNTPGGSVSAGLAIYDVIQAFSDKISIYCMGMAASMGAVLLTSGAKGRRFILPHSKVMIHEPLISGGVGGSATSIQRTAESIIDTKKTINGIIAKHTGKDIEEIDRATAYDNYFTAEEAIEFGICDKIAELSELGFLTAKQLI